MLWWLGCSLMMDMSSIKMFEWSSYKLEITFFLRSCSDIICLFGKLNGWMVCSNLSLYYAVLYLHKQINMP